MKKVLIDVKNVQKSIGETHILNGIDAEIFEGDFTVIMGASGSGKSTLLYALSGMDRATSGSVIYGDDDIVTLSEKRLAKLRATDFSFVFQQMHLVSNLTILENILVAGFASKIEATSKNPASQIFRELLRVVNRYISTIYNIAFSELLPKTEVFGSSLDNVQERANVLIKKMGLDEVAKKFPSQVSGGEAQRAAIARAVVSNPKMLFADEPTGSLNKATSVDVLNLFSELNSEGLSILMVTHDKNAALRGNRILYLEDGTIKGELDLGAFNPSDTAESVEREKRLDDWLKRMGW